jgi:hypothetical protein
MKSGRIISIPVSPAGREPNFAKSCIFSLLHG